MSLGQGNSFNFGEEELRILREKTKKDIYEDSIKISTALDNINRKIDAVTSDYYVDINPILISFEEASQYKVGEEQRMDNGIVFWATISNKEHIQFMCLMPAGSTFLKHYHDCLEITKVIEGELHDWSRCSVLEEGQQIAYAKDEIHSPSTSEESKWEVNLYKDL